MTEMTLRWMEWWCDCCDFGPEWRNDGWMKLISKLRDWACFQKYTSFHPHSVSQAPFLSQKTARVKSSWVNWHWNDISPLYFSFLDILSILKCRRNDGTRRNEGGFGAMEKNQPRNICQSAIILLIRESFSFHSVILIRQIIVLNCFQSSLNDVRMNKIDIWMNESGFVSI